ncbi:hypothetical protein [Enterobacter hormaechei]
MYWIELINVKGNKILKLDNVNNEQLHIMILILSQYNIELRWGKYNPVVVEGGCLGWCESVPNIQD